MYVTYAEVIARYPILGTWGKTEMQVNSDLIYFAEKDLDAKLASQYTVPFSEGYPIIKDLTMDMCYLKALATSDPEKLEDFEKYVNGRIEKILKGEAEIVTDAGILGRSGSGNVSVFSNTKNHHPSFSMLDEESVHSHVSSSLLNELEGERS